MKNTTKYYLAAIAVLTTTLQNPAVQAAIGALLHAHPNASAITMGLMMALATVHVPVDTPVSPSLSK